MGLDGEPSKSEKVIKNILINLIMTPHDLKTDLEKAEKSKDIRVMLLYVNLYNEYFINLLYKSSVVEGEYDKCIKCQKYNAPKFKQQVDKLAQIGIVASEYSHDTLIKLIFDLRNELAHQLNYDIDELSKRFSEAHWLGLVDDTNLISNFLNQATLWEKVKMAVFATVTTLYQKYETLNNRNPEQSIIFKINPEGTRSEIEIIPY